MSNLPMRDSGPSPGAWLLAGGVLLGLGFVLFAGISEAAAIIVVRAPGRMVQMPGGSTPQNLDKLTAAFGPAVNDLGNGLYSVRVATDLSAKIPGAKVL